MGNIGVAIIGARGIGPLRAHSCAQISQVEQLAVCVSLINKKWF